MDIVQEVVMVQESARSIFCGDGGVGSELEEVFLRLPYLARFSTSMCTYQHDFMHFFHLHPYLSLISLKMKYGIFVSVRSGIE